MERSREDALNARLDLEAMADNGVLTRQLVTRLQRLRVLRRDLVHECPTPTAEQVHEAARLVAADFPRFRNTYLRWVCSH
jgi:uncharacterized protein YutE (UPF0331/DUF86 family)